MVANSICKIIIIVVSVANLIHVQRKKDRTQAHVCKFTCLFAHVSYLHTKNIQNMQCDMNLFQNKNQQTDASPFLLHASALNTIHERFYISIDAEAQIGENKRICNTKHHWLMYTSAPFIHVYRHSGKRNACAPAK